MAKRVMLGIRVAPALAKFISQMAADLGTSVSAIGEELLQDGLSVRLGERMSFESRLEAIAAKALAQQAERMTRLASTAARETMILRLFAAQVAAHYGIDPAPLMENARIEVGRRMQRGDHGS